VVAKSTGGQGSRRAVAPSDDDDNDDLHKKNITYGMVQSQLLNMFASIYDVKFLEAVYFNRPSHSAIHYILQKFLLRVCL
jgi:hypothetical protein